MQWTFSPASGTLPLKRKGSSPQLHQLANKRTHQVCLAAASQPGGAGGTTAAAEVASTSADAPALVDVSAVAAKHGWNLQQRNDWSHDKRVMMLPVAAIRRPLQGTRSNDQEKVAALMHSIQEIGLQEPIDVLEVDGQYWGFSGCHRYEAHARLGKEQILCRVRKATPQVLKMHLM